MDVKSIGTFNLSETDFIMINSLELYSFNIRNTLNFNYGKISRLRIL